MSPSPAEIRIGKKESLVVPVMSHARKKIVMFLRATCRRAQAEARPEELQGCSALSLQETHCEREGSRAEDWQLVK